MRNLLIALGNLNNAQVENQLLELAKGENCMPIMMAIVGRELPSSFREEYQEMYMKAIEILCEARGVEYSMPQTSRSVKV
jgi:hypothetical protein